MITQCPQCSSIKLRTFSNFNEKTNVWEWWKGCNDCTWQARDTDEEKKHPEYYNRMETSPAKLNKQDDINKKEKK